MKFIKVEKSNLQQIITAKNIYLFKIRNSRLKAKRIAILEVFSLFNKIATIIKNGPLSEVKGCFCIAINRENATDVKQKLTLLGYCDRVFEAVFENAKGINFTDIEIENLNWKGLIFDLKEIYKENKELFYSENPDNREFILFDNFGREKTVKGYRGDGTETGRRALPSEDCKMMVNLSGLDENSVLLDMFAGAGGIIFQARKVTNKLISNDIDEKLTAGLKSYGAKHYVGNAKDLKLENSSIDALVTEVPFSPNCTNTIIQALTNIYNNLKCTAKIILMCADYQAEEILNGTKELYKNYINFDLNRKGTNVVILGFVKSEELFRELKGVVDFVKTIY